MSTDSVEEIVAFSENEAIPFPLLSDQDGSVARRYETFGTADVDDDTFEIAFRNPYVIGLDGEIEAVYEGVSLEDHAAEILDEVAALDAT